MELQQVTEILNQIRNRLNQKLIGQVDIVDQVLIALMANGHVLIEGIPGLGKTLLVRALAECFDGDFKRIQFTPDLMPADVTGHVMFDMEKNRFRLRAGPVFTNLLLADEINRAPAKTQAALLEVMQERQVTLEGQSRSLPHPFMVLATQNPIDQEGTYPLPEAQLDRFLMKIFIDYPDKTTEVEIARMISTGHIDDQAAIAKSDAMLSSEQIKALQEFAASVEIDEQVMLYAVDLVRATRENASIHRGAGPRASIALLRAARAQALLNERNFVTPDDVKAVAKPVMRHRVQLAAETEIEGLTSDQVLNQVFAAVDAPRT